MPLLIVMGVVVALSASHYGARKERAKALARHSSIGERSGGGRPGGRTLHDDERQPVSLLDELDAQTMSVAAAVGGLVCASGASEVISYSLIRVTTGLTILVVNVSRSPPCRSLLPHPGRQVRCYHHRMRPVRSWGHRIDGLDCF